MEMKMKTFFERSFSEPIQNHINSCFKSINNNSDNTKSIEKLYRFTDSFRIKNQYSALFYWYIVREVAVEKKLDYLVLVQQLYESLKSTYINNYGEEDLTADDEDEEQKEKKSKLDQSVEFKDKTDKEEEDDEEEDDEEDDEEEDQEEEDYEEEEDSDEDSETNDKEHKKKESIKLLIKVYESSIINNTFIQKDIKSIQKFYLNNYQINSVDVSLTETTTNNDNIIKAPTQLIKVYNQFQKESLLIKHNYADKQLFTRKPITKYEANHPMISYSIYEDPVNLVKQIGVNKIGDWSIVPSLELFKECFKVYTNNILDGINWGIDEQSRVIVSGGSVTSCLSSLPKPLIKQYLELLNIYRLLSNHCGLPFSASKLIFEYLKPYSQFYQDLFNHYHAGKSPYMNGDIDLFIIANTIDEGKKKLESVAQKIRENMIQKKGHDFKFVRTQNSITIVSEYPYRPIQLMIFFIRSIEDLILFYDIDCSCTAYNGDNVYVLPRTVNAFNKRLNMIPPSIFSEDNDRLYKYCLRGFDSICFENCIHKPRCDTKPRLYHQVLQYIPKDAYNRPKFIVSSYNEGSSIFHFPYGPETKFNEVLEAIDIYSYRSSSKFKTSMLEMNPKKDVIQILPPEWRFKHIKVHALSSNVKFKCYVCKEPLEDTTTRVCPYCVRNSSNKIFNFITDGHTRNSKFALNQKVAIVTGGRIKIGYEIAKFLLDCGFKVIITTRFPASAYEQYKNNCPPETLSRLYIYGVDFRNLGSVQQFIDTVKKEFSRIDILINNAAQTIRYPRAYYHNLLVKEKDIASSFKTIPVNILSTINNNNKSIENNNSNKQILVFNNKSNSSTDLVESIITKDDEDEINESLFPTGKTDSHGQQLDLRTKHTWNTNIEDITTAEMLEVQLINNTVPFMLINQLSSHMGLNKNDDEIIEGLSDEAKVKYLEAKNKIIRNDWSIIVNVTSPEGNINHEPNSISGFHCHTNMAKASLNILTKSIAYQFEKKNIYVIGSDTGWVSDMMPYSPIGAPSRPPPLSEFAGASRVLYPIFHHLFKKERFPSGVQFVNFKPTNW